MHELKLFTSLFKPRSSGTVVAIMLPTSDTEDDDDDINPLDRSFYVPVDQSPAEDDWEFLRRFPDEDEDTDLLGIPVDRSWPEDNWEHQLKYGK